MRRAAEFIRGPSSSALRRFLTAGLSPVGYKALMQTEPQPTRSQRYREILATLGKHGFAAAGAGLRFHGNGESGAHIARELRMACEELGPTFIKLGQLLSTRGDLLPRDYREELAKLQDSVPPIELETIVAAIESELGAPPLEIFAEFDPVPIACASIGQVHRARLTDGTDVVVKVRKPGIRALIEYDLDIIAKLAASAEKLFPDLAGYDADGLIDEFGEMLRAELDYTREARNVALFHRMLEDEPGIELPDVVGEYSTSHVLTLTYVDGTKVTETPVLADKRRGDAAERIARLVFEPAFVHGVFHADPHAGNVLVRLDGTIGAIDFGMVGHLSEDQRRKLADLFLAVHRQDVQRVTDRLIDLAPPSGPVDRVELSRELERLLERYLSSTLARVQFGAALAEMLDIIREHRLRMPAAVSLFFKAASMCESLILAIAPEKPLRAFLEPIASNVAVAKLDPREWGERAKTAALETAELSMELPRRADRVLTDIERGNLRIWTRVEDVEPALLRLEKIAERINATMIAASCIVGLTILLAFYHPEGWQMAVGWILWISVVVAVLWVFRTAVATLRKGR